MLIYANLVNYEKYPIVIIRHPAIFNNWGSMQLIYVIKAQGTNHFRVHLGVIPARKFKIVTRIGRHIGFMLIRNGHTLLIFIWSSSSTIITQV